MEKHGAIQPGVTPPENKDTAPVVDRPQVIKAATNDRAQAVDELDADFRKAAAKAVFKSL